MEKVILDHSCDNSIRRSLSGLVSLFGDFASFYFLKIENDSFLISGSSEYISINSELSSEYQMDVFISINDMREGYRFTIRDENEVQVISRYSKGMKEGKEITIFGNEKTISLYINDLKNGEELYYVDGRLWGKKFFVNGRELIPVQRGSFHH